VEIKNLGSGFKKVVPKQRRDEKDRTWPPWSIAAASAKLSAPASRPEMALLLDQGSKRVKQHGSSRLTSAVRSTQRKIKKGEGKRKENEH
jgi:hypothetical protein